LPTADVVLFAVATVCAVSPMVPAVPGFHRWIAVSTSQCWAGGADAKRVVSTSCAVANFKTRRDIRFAFLFVSVCDTWFTSCATETSVVLENVGNAVLYWRAVPTEAWGVVVTMDNGALMPGSSVVIGLKSSASGLPPSTYPGALTILTNEVVGVSANPTLANVGVGSSNHSVSWAIQVVVALLFPTTQAIRLTPDAAPHESTYTVVNLAGVPILAVVSTLWSSTWVTANVQSAIIKDADVLAVGVSTRFDAVGLGAISRNVCVTLPPAPSDVFSCRLLSVSYHVNVTCWTEATADELAGNGTTSIVVSGHELASLADSDKFYAQISLPPILVHIDYYVGKPVARYSNCRLRSTVSVLRIYSAIEVGISLSDAVGFTVPLTLEALQHVGFQFASSTSREGVPNATVTSYELDFVSTEILVTIQALELGTLQIAVIVSGENIPESSGPLVSVVSPVCNSSQHVQLTEDGKQCICKLGRYSDGKLCLPCPPGTYQPRLQNVTLSQCVAVVVSISWWFHRSACADVV
jgi:hypothetical protein